MLVRIKQTKSVVNLTNHLNFMQDTHKRNSHKITIIASVAIVSVALSFIGCKHYHARITIAKLDAESRMERKSTHPYNHCLNIVLDKACKSSTQNCDIKQAQEVCFGLQGGGKPDKNAYKNITANKDREISMVNASKNKAN